VLDTARQLEAGEVIDLTPDIKPNYDFFKTGPGYSAKETTGSNGLGRKPLVFQGQFYFMVHRVDQQFRPMCGEPRIIFLQHHHDHQRRRLPIGQRSCNKPGDW
jgi:hypothetical protein